MRFSCGRSCWTSQCHLCFGINLEKERKRASFLKKSQIDPLRKNLFSSWTCLDLNTLLVWLPATVCTRSKKQDDNEVGVTFHTTCARTNIIHLNVLSASTRDRGFCTTKPKLLSTHWSASLHFNFSESVFWNIWKICLQTSVTAEFL